MIVKNSLSDEINKEEISLKENVLIFLKVIIQKSKQLLFLSLPFKYL